MAKLKNIREIINKLDEKKYLNEFINLTFNYNLKKTDSVVVYVQDIDDTQILYIYEKYNKNRMQFYEFLMEESPIYLKKISSFNIITNFIYINKCLEIYQNEKNHNNLIKFVASFFMTDQKKVLMEYLPIYIVDIIVSSC